jgi:peptide deformylase
MAPRPIVPFPDIRLRTIADPITDFDTDLKALATDLVDTMRAAPGIGIAGPHIGVALRLIAIQLAPDQPLHVCANPVVLWASDDTARHAEGSISMPGISEEIERPVRVRVGFQDLDGGRQEIDADGLLSVCFQHEIDQLDGIFWLQRLSRLKRDRAIKRFGKRG